MSSPVEFCGETFWLSEPGHYAWQDMVELAEAGADSESVAGFRAITNLIAACMSDDDYRRWEAVARKNRATGVEMIRVVVAGVTGRPTQQPSDSSDGLPSTDTSSMDDSFSRAMARREGRPDLQLALVRAQEARAAS